jgi:C4-dicarboxylate-specific signal transduction histidine kinase
VRNLPRVTIRAIVEVSVSDLGPGLAGEAEQKIFEQFFSTKHRDGLGARIDGPSSKAHERASVSRNQPRGGMRFFVLTPTRSRHER